MSGEGGAHTDRNARIRRRDGRDSDSDSDSDRDRHAEW